jgi:hypothetical protein
MGMLASRFVTLSWAGLLTLLLLPATAYAQAAITGVVKDDSGAVLPGVTVEASSPVLIEKVRSVTTDATGQYRIVDLRPGIYSITFALPGFSTVKRDGIELSGSFTATVNGDLKVGALEETITVTGETPTVDVQSARQQQTLSKDVISAIPTSRMASSVQAAPVAASREPQATSTEAGRLIRGRSTTGSTPASTAGAAGCSWPTSADRRKSSSAPPAALAKRKPAV